VTARTAARPPAAGHAPNRVTARAEIIAEAGPAGGTRLPVLSSQAPFLQVIGSTRPHAPLPA
jgi:hypothetical protein